LSHASGGLYRLLERAGAYERVQRLLGADGARRRLAAEVIRARPGDRVLDVGCGTGSLLDLLPTSVHYVGFDLNPDYVAAAQRRYGDRGSFFCARVETADVENRGGGFDLVVAKGLLHHLADGAVRGLAEMAHRVLVPGGILITVDPVRHAGQSWVSRLLMACDRGRAVRDAEGYLRLLRDTFPDAQGQLFTDLLPVPYSHFAVRCERLAGGRG
jgi:cyclopropane fatty-acyl-phospholipid synthase-like methyltransferase